MALDPVAKHRRDFRRKIILPIAATSAGLIFVLMVLPGILLLTDTISTGHVATVASFLLAICILLPLIIVFLGIDVLFIMLAYGSGKIPAKIYGRLQSVRRLVQRTGDVTVKVMNNINRPLIALNTRLTRWGYVVGHLLGLSGKTPENTPATPPVTTKQP
jgi:hypothetical protein